MKKIKKHLYSFTCTDALIFISFPVIRQAMGPLIAAPVFYILPSSGLYVCS